MCLTQSSKCSTWAAVHTTQQALPSPRRHRNKDLNGPFPSDQCLRLSLISATTSSQFLADRGEQVMFRWEQRDDNAAPRK